MSFTMLIILAATQYFYNRPLLPDMKRDLPWHIWLILWLYIDLPICVGAVFILLGPLIVARMCAAEIEVIKPLLVGFEGYLPLERWEKNIFGTRRAPGKMKWSSEGSTLSKKELSPDSSYRGVDPMQNDVAIERLVEDAASGNTSDNTKVFTPVDTRTMTVTLFAA
jgi:hypothetical protein